MQVAFSKPTPPWCMQCENTWHGGHGGWAQGQAQGAMQCTCIKWA